MSENPGKVAPPGPSTSRGSILLAAVVIVAAVLAAYANTLRAPFVFDDIPGIEENTTIRNLADLPTVLAASPDIASGSSGRPLVNLSLAINYAIGGIDPTGYHAVNIALHALAALALFGLVRRTLLLPALQPRMGAAALPVAFGSALLWALHPLQTETVTCSIQRNEGLSGLFYLSACYAFVRSIEPGDGRGNRWSILALVYCFLGVLSKELVATVPLILLLYDRTFVAGTFAAAWKRRRGLYLALSASWIPLVWIVYSGHSRGGTVGFGLGTSPWIYFLTQCKAVVLYLRLAIWPHPLVLDYGTGVVSGLSEVWGRALFLSVLFAATVWALRHKPVAGFLGAWFFVILAPSSSFLPLKSQTIAEHRMYLPLASLALPAAGLLWLGLGRRASIVVAALAIALGIATASRNRDYSSVISIWEDTVKKQPDNPRGTINLFLELMTLGRLDESLRLGAKVVETYPNDSKLHVNYGTVLFRAGRTTEATAQYEAAIRIDPTNPEAHFNLGNLDAQAGRFPQAKEHYDAVLRVNPTHLKARVNLGNVHTTLGRLEDALDQFRYAQRIAPDNADVNFSLGNAYAELGRLDDAVNAYTETLKLAPGHPGAAANLAQARRILQSRGGAPGRPGP